VGDRRARLNPDNPGKHERERADRDPAATTAEGDCSGGHTDYSA
jgi:hypothetical protein